MSETWAGLPLESYSKEQLIQIMTEIIQERRKRDNELIKMMYPDLLKEPS